MTGEMDMLLALRIVAESKRYCSVLDERIYLIHQTTPTNVPRSRRRVVTATLAASGSSLRPLYKADGKAAAEYWKAQPHTIGKIVYKQA